MPRRIIAAVAGRYILDNPPTPLPGRGGKVERDNYIASLSVSKLSEWLFEGGNPDYLNANPDVIGFRLDSNGGITPPFGGPICYAGDDSILPNHGVNETFDCNNWPGTPTSHCWEIWFNHPPYNPGFDQINKSAEISMFGNRLNATRFVGQLWAGVSNGRRITRFPTIGRTGNVGIEPFVDFYGDGKTHQMLIVAEPGNRDYHIMIIDGVPMGEDTDSDSFITAHDGGSASMAFNGQQGNPDDEFAGAQHGPLVIYDGGEHMTLQKCRELYELSVFDGVDMLTVPKWIPLDSEDVTIEPRAMQVITTGSTNNGSGARSGAIPRSGKRYFEMQVLDQGTSPNGCRLGIRRMITDHAVGGLTGVGDSGNKHHFFVWGNGILFDDEQDTGIDPDSGSASTQTGVTIMVAIDWKTGRFWIGRDGVWGDNGGDPENDLNPVDTLDRDTNWAASVNNFNAFSGAVVRLKTNAAAMKYTIPPGFIAWEGADPSEVGGVGPNARKEMLKAAGQQVDREYLFDQEGPLGTEHLHDTGDPVDSNYFYLTEGTGLVRTRQPALCTAHPFSLGTNRDANDPTVRNNQVMNVRPFHTLELWFRWDEVPGLVKAVLLNASNNTGVSISKYDASTRAPACGSEFGAGVIWESSFDIYGNADPHQLLEIRDEEGSTAYKVMLDGAVIAEGNNTGFMGINTGGIHINGDYNTADGSAASAADYSSFRMISGYKGMDVVEARKYYLASRIQPLRPTGVENGEILDAAMSASSEFAGFEAENGRLNGPFGWAPAAAVADEYLTIDLGQVRTVRKIATQGNGNINNEFVLTYDLEYSDDDVSYTSHPENPIATGNVDKDTVATQAFAPFEARYVRIVEKTFNSFPTMRVEVFADSLDPVQMLPVPQWNEVDGENIALVGAPGIFEDITLGDVVDNTGARGGPIPRNGRVYFELEIINQGDANFWNIGFRSLLDPVEDLGSHDVIDEESGLYVNNITCYKGAFPTPTTVQGGFGNQSTGRVYMFAMDFSTGEVWMGSDGTWHGTQDPELRINPLNFVLDGHYGPWIAGDSAIGNQQVALHTKAADLVYPVTGFIPWAVYTEGYASGLGDGLKYQEAVIADQPMGYWRCEETAGTTLGDVLAANDATLQGTYTLNDPGLITGGSVAVTFNGASGDGAQVASPGAGLRMLGDMTMECWANFDTIVSASDTLISFDASGELEADNFLYRLDRTNSGFLQAFHEDGAGNNNTATSGWPVADNTTAHIVVVRDSVAKTYAFYVDGVLRDTVGYTNNPTGGSNGSFWIGTSSGDDPIDGTIDEVAVYDYKLPIERIKAHYHAGVT